MNQAREPNKMSTNSCLLLTLTAAFLSVNALAQGAGHKPESPAVRAGIVARVNGEPVTRAQLERLLANPREHYLLVQELGVQDPDPKELDRLAVRKLIHRRLILHEGARRNLIVTDKDLDQALTSLRRRFTDLKSFGMWMKQEGLDDQSLFESTRAEMLAARVRAALVEGVRVSEEQAKEYYQAHKDDLKTEEAWLQIIVVKDAAAAAEIQAALRKGDDFGRLARQRSVGLRGARGGDAGWVDVETLWPPMRQAVSALKPGEAIGPLQRGEEFLIVRLEERRPGRTKTLAEARPEIERRVLSETQEEVVRAWLTEQEKTSRIEVFLDQNQSQKGMSTTVYEERHAKETTHDRSVDAH